MRKLIAVACIFMLGIALGDDKDGVRPPTPEELRWMQENVIVAQDVQPNALAIQRLNKERQAKGLPPLALTPAPMGREFSGVPAKWSSPAASRSVPVALPARVDNSLSPTFPPIGDQGSEGSCVAFSTIYYAMTNNTALARGWTDVKTNPGHRFSPKFVYNMLNCGYNAGVWPLNCYQLVQQTGCPTWAEYPYDGTDYKSWCTNGAIWRDAINYRMDQCGSIGDGNASTCGVDTKAGLQAMKAMLANGYVLNFTTYFGSWNYANTPIQDIGDGACDNSGWVGQNACVCQSGQNTWHAMTIVGYDDDVWVDVNGNGSMDPEEQGVLKIANSWGGNGFYYVSYDALKAATAIPGGPTPSGRSPCFVSCQAYWIAARPAYSPQVVATFTLNQAIRSQIAAYIGLSNTSTTTPSNLWGTYAFNGNYGPAFDGTTTACDGAFALDFTDLKPPLGVPLRFYLQTRDLAAGSPTIIKAFSITDVANNVTVSATIPSLPQSVDNATLNVYIEYTIPGGDAGPTISSMPDQNIVENTSSGPIGFALSAGASVVSVSSSNAILVAEADIVLGGAGTSRTLDVSPLPFQTGTTTIKVTVGDGQLTASASFVVTVIPSSGPETYLLTVGNGTGGGNYAAGTVVNISAIMPAGQSFTGWTGSTAIADATAASTTITMPAADTAVTANHASGPGPSALSLTVTKMQGSLKFASGQALCSISGSLSLLSFAPGDAMVIINGEGASFTLGTKGKGSSSQGSLMLKMPKAFKGGMIAFSAKLAHGWATSWNSLVSQQTGSITIPVSLTIGGATYAATPSMSYKNNGHGVGTFKLQ